VSRATIAVLTLAVAGSLLACGSEESDQLSEDAVRECLAENEIGAQPRGEGAAGPPVYLSAAPDFSAYSRDGTRVDLIVQGTEEKARRTAADVRGAMLPLGIPDADRRVVVNRNAVAVFADSPSPESRETVSACLE
jgi:hypothetical protein